MSSRPPRRALVPPASAPAAQRTARSDGEDTRARLLQAAFTLFAERGYAQTSVRAIAEAAGSNVAAIAYHFGDKAGLYSATFYEPMGSSGALLPLLQDEGRTLSEVLQAYFAALLQPLQHDDLVRQAIRLHVRELLEPTHVWPELIERECRGPHLALVQRLCSHLGLARADDDLHRLVFTIHGLLMQMWTQRDALEAVAPRLARPAAVAGWVDRLTGFALALIDSETQRRGLPAPLLFPRKEPTP